MKGVLEANNAFIKQRCEELSAHTSAAVNSLKDAALSLGTDHEFLKRVVGQVHENLGREDRVRSPGAQAKG